MPVSDWEPGPDEVASWVRERTRANGVYVGTFTSVTQPTDEQVEQVVDDAADMVSALIGEDIPPKYWDRARRLVALRAAMQVELSFFGADVAANRSPYPQLKALYDEDAEVVRLALGESGGEEPGDADLRPQGGFAATADPGVFGIPTVAPWGPEGLGPPGLEGWARYGSVSSAYLPW